MKKELFTKFVSFVLIIVALLSVTSCGRDKGVATPSATSTADNLAVSTQKDVESNKPTSESPMTSENALILADDPYVDGEENETVKSMATSTTTPMISTNLTGTLFLKNDGTVWMLGRVVVNSDDCARSPIQIPELTGIVSIASGATAFYALKNDGTVWSWGDNGFGQLGDGTNTNRLIPQKVSGLTDVKAIVTGGDSVCALKNDGTVWRWGYRSGSNIRIPEQCSTLTDVTKIMILGSAIVRFDADGLIDSDFTGYTGVHKAFQQLDGVTAVVGGNSETYFALLDDGTVWGCGENRYGNVGDGTTENRSDSYVKISGIANIKEIISTGSYSHALNQDGTVWSWGYNANGELGDGTTDYRSYPIQVKGLSDITGISTYNHSTFAMKSDGTVWAWGVNRDGRLGDGTEMDRNAAVQVRGEGGKGYFNLLVLADDISIEGGENEATDTETWQVRDAFLYTNTFVDKDLYIKPNGDLVVRRGSRSNQDRIIPGVKEVCGYYDGFHFVKNDGTLWSSYVNGDGNGIPKDEPFRILDDVIKLYGHNDAFYAICSDYSLYYSYSTLNGSHNVVYETAKVMSNVKYLSTITHDDIALFFAAITLDNRLYRLNRTTDHEAEPLLQEQVSDVVFADGHYIVDEKGRLYEYSSEIDSNVITGGHNSKPFFIKTDGTMWGYGFGDAGDGSSAKVIDNVIMIIGFGYDLILKNDGTVWTVKDGGPALNPFVFVELPGINSAVHLTERGGVILNDGSVYDVSDYLGIMKILSLSSDFNKLEIVDGVTVKLPERISQLADKFPWSSDSGSAPVVTP